MNIGDLVLIRNGGAYGLFDLNDSEGDILKSGTAGILLDKVPIKHKIRGTVGIQCYFTVYCKISVDNKNFWIPEGSLQKPSHKLLWGYIKKYSKQPKL
jgi:hypothetical protein